MYETLPTGNGPPRCRTRPSAVEAITGWSAWHHKTVVFG